jgi:hypothetical protein
MQYVNVSDGTKILIIQQLESVDLTVTFKDSNGDKIDLTNYELAAYIKKSYNDELATVKATCTIDADPTSGIAYVSISSEDTGSMSACKDLVNTSNYKSANSTGKYVWDILLTNTITGKVNWIPGGDIIVSPTATKEVEEE